MLLAYLCSLDEGIKKHRPEALKSMKIKLQGLQNPFQKQLKSDTASEEAFKFQFFENLWFFWWILASKTDLKSKKKCWTCDVQKTIHFWIIFSWNFLRSGFRKSKENLLFLEFLSKNLILLKPSFFPMENCYFLGFELSKTNQISM